MVKRSAFFAAHASAAVRGVATLPAALLAEHRRWRGASGRFEPAVYYGFSDLPDRTECASGGIIKCQDLQQRFPNAAAQPTILYLISSALPSDAAWQMRMAKRCGGCVVLNQNGVAYPGWHGAGWQVTNTANAIIHAGADHVIYQSRFCRDAAERFLRARRGSASILHNPVDTAAFAPDVLPLPRAPLVLLTAGSHHFGYRIATCLDVLAGVRRCYPDARLLVAGRLCWAASEAASAAEAEAWVAAAGLGAHVEFTGPYTQSAAPRLMRRAHILVHPVYNDPCPRLVVEAMACGLPVAYSASGGMPELVGEGAGVGVAAPSDWKAMHPPDAADLTEAVLRLARDLPGYAAKARQRAVQALDVRTWLDSHAGLFRSLLDSRRKG